MRVLIAAVLATIYPGLGHVYLREWLRALAWFGLSILAAAVVVPPEILAASQTGGLDGLVEAARDLPNDVLLTLVMIRGLNVVDAVWLALRRKPSRRSADGPSCPNCGRELDAELDFCHWCTTHLEGAVDESRADGGLS